MALILTYSSWLQLLCDKLSCIRTCCPVCLPSDHLSIHWLFELFSSCHLSFYHSNCDRWNMNSLISFAIQKQFTQILWLINRYRTYRKYYTIKHGINASSFLVMLSDHFNHMNISVRYVCVHCAYYWVWPGI